MKFLADECCDAGLVYELRKMGHEIHYIAEDNTGFKDESIITIAWEQDRIIITEDKDFGELAVRFKKPVHGLILLRFPPSKRGLKIPSLLRLIELGQEYISGCLIIIDPNKTRRIALGRPQ